MEKMNDREGAILSACLMIIAATKGTDDDVMNATPGRGGVLGLAMLSNKYMTEALRLKNSVELMLYVQKAFEGGVDAGQEKQDASKVLVGSDS